MMWRGDRMRNCRIDAGFDQEYLARILRVSKSCINAYENGRSTPSVSKIDAIARALNADVAMLLDMKELDIYKAGFKDGVAFVNRRVEP